MSDAIREQSKRLDLLISETDAIYHEATLKLGLTDSAMSVLYTICLFDGECSLRDIIAYSGIPKQTVNSALRRLEADGAVCLEAAGPRSKTVCLTESGKLLADRTARRIIQAENEIFAAWPREDVETYLALTERFLSDIREKADQL